MGIRSRIAGAVSNWFQGEYVPYDNPPDSGVFIVGGYHKRHWTASAVATIWRFVAAEWKWLLGFIVAVLALYANFSLKR